MIIHSLNPFQNYTEHLMFFGRTLLYLGIIIISIIACVWLNLKFNLKLKIRYFLLIGIICQIFHGWQYSVSATYAQAEEGSSWTLFGGLIGFAIAFLMYKWNDKDDSTKD